ncbi:MAG: esterase [Gammaproteobacteria bacterium]|nr:esterase [Gammaproteobacteria bacterium]
MFRKHEIIPSEAMGRGIHVWRYGHFGPPLVAFPSASGMAHEWESHGMVEAMSDWLEQGRLKLYTVESNVSEAWTRKESPPQWRIKRHQLYEHFVMNDLVPFIRADCNKADIPIALTGVSLGAFYAANFALKFPKIFRYALCMSGRYDATWMTEGFTNDDIYFNNPIAYVPGIEGEYLNTIREFTHLALVCGQGKWEDGNIEDTIRLAELLQEKGISHQLDLWGHDVSHQWPWWMKQARHHLAGYLHAAG